MKETQNVGKVIEVPELFGNGDKTINDWRNAHNQEFDELLFDLLLEERLIKISGVKYHELAEGEKCTFRDNTHDTKIVRVTRNGYILLTSYYFNKRSLEVKKKNIEKISKQMWNYTYSILILTAIDVFLVATMF
ncbi:hypothetical protein B6U74_05245 [Candidatus Bathyarchaeota archaeon ex4484_205]|nr:MAG: hypothetical protein B6U74_05245 [Candidatus Bathyarchaeota archaeon ex4484_205]RLA96714.1 MAG: hypothetical protein DRG69_00020 [Deltaproteobacteria bacterium]RLF70307.1 MAG: hypothetical protein DRN40_04870 [Thermoplasmata archaeon]